MEPTETTHHGCVQGPAQQPDTEKVGSLLKMVFLMLTLPRPRSLEAAFLVVEFDFPLEELCSDSWAKELGNQWAPADVSQASFPWTASCIT